MHCILHARPALLTSSVRYDMRMITGNLKRICGSVICSLHAVIISLSKLLVFKVDLIISLTLLLRIGRIGLTFKYLICQIAAPTNTPI
jgi:hypothetical protein